MLLQVVVSGGNIGEMAMHFLEKYGLMAVRIPSKFDLRRFCRATGSVALVKLQTPQADELGFAKQVTLPVRGSRFMVENRYNLDCCMSVTHGAADVGSVL